MWEWKREPTRQEQRESAPETTPHRSRKNRRRWCGGHVGREHTPVIDESKWAAWRKARGISTKYRGYRWAPRYRWLLEGEPVPHDALEHKHGYSVITGYEWVCEHSRFCERCGKILEESLRRSCPDFYERVPR